MCCGFMHNYTPVCYAKKTETPPNYAVGTPIPYSECSGFDFLSVGPEV